MQLQVTGAITGIEARNGGWFAVAILEEGNEYPKKLSTKKPDIVQQAQQMMGQYVTALYNESESTNINPHNGMPYMNRFLEALAMPGTVPPPAPQQSFQPQPAQPPTQIIGQPQQWQPQPQPQVPPQPQPQVLRISEDLREARIHRQAASKVAVQLLDHLDVPDRNLASLIRISEQLVQYYANGVQWTTPPVQPPQTQPRNPQQEWAADPDAHPNPGAAPQQASYEQPDTQGRPAGFPPEADPYDDIPF